MADYSVTARQLVELTGMPYPVLVDLQKRGVVSPSKVRGVGTGHSSVYDTADVFAVWALQRFRPTTGTTQLLRSLFDFWHSPDGLAVVHGDAGKDGVIVVDGSGRVSLEHQTDLKELAKLRDSATLLVIEPSLVAEEIYLALSEGRILGRLLKPLPSGRLPRPKNPVAKKAASKGSAPRRPGVREQEVAVTRPGTKTVKRAKEQKHD